MKTAKIYLSDRKAADHLMSKIAEKNFTAHRSPNSRDRSRAYAEKTDLIAEGIHELDPDCLYLSYQIDCQTGVLHLLTTFIGSRARSFHTPFSRLPGSIQLLAVIRLGNPYVFVANWRAQMN